MTTTLDKSQCLTGQGICARPGWTRTAIKKFIGEPDFVTDRYGGGTINWYSLARVEHAERTDAFRVWSAKSEARKLSAKQGASTRRENAARSMMATIDAGLAIGSLTPKLLSLKEIDAAACVYRAFDPEDWIHIERKRMNYIRHCLTSYDQIRHALGLYPRTQSGSRSAAYDVLRDTVTEEIEKVYPYLGRELEDEERVIERALDTLYLERQEAACSARRLSEKKRSQMPSALLH